MFILPIGHETTTVRRVPWVTFGMMALCTLLLLWTEHGGSPANQEMAELQAQIAEVSKRAIVAYSDLQMQKKNGQGHIDRLEEDLWDQKTLGARQLRLRGQEEAFRAGKLLPKDHPVYLEYVALKRRLEAAEGRVPIAVLGYQPALDGLLEMVTSMFAHGGYLHLIGNLWFLYLTGCYLEDRWGRGVYTAFYLLAGISACVTYAALHPNSEVFLVGASGAISGAMGAFLVCFARTKIHFFAFYMFGLRPRNTRFSAPAWLMLPLWLLDQVMMMHVEMVTGVAHSAHVGGFVFGLATAGVFMLTGVDRELDAAVERVHVGDDGWQEDGDFIAALDARAEGDFPRAITLLWQAIQHDPSRPEVHEAMLHTCVQAKAEGVAIPSVTFLMHHHHAAANHGELLALYRLLRRDLPGALPGARELSWVVDSARRERDAVSVVHAAGMLLLRHADSPHTPPALWHAAQVQADQGRPNLMKKTLQKLVERFPTDQFAQKARQQLAGASA